MLEWLGAQPPSVGTFLGTLIGSSLGLLALLVGALFNAYLNRVRDDRLRNEEARSIRSALAGELAGIRDTLNSLADEVGKKNVADDTAWNSFLVSDPASLARVMPPLLPKFGLLSPETVAQVVEIYVIIEHLRPSFLLIGGQDHSNKLHIAMPQKSAGAFAEMARGVATKIDAVIVALNAQR